MKNKIFLIRVYCPYVENLFFSKKIYLQILQILGTPRIRFECVYCNKLLCIYLTFENCMIHKIMKVNFFTYFRKS